RYDASIFHDDDNGPSDDPVLAGGRGLFVARELESIAVLHAVRAKEPPRPKSPVTLELELIDDLGVHFKSGDAIDTAARAEKPLVPPVRALDATGTEANPKNVDLRFDFDAFPPSLLLHRPDDATRIELPSAHPGLALMGTGRLRARVFATLRDQRVIDA